MAAPIQGVGHEGPRESVSEVQCMYESGETWLLGFERFKDVAGEFLQPLDGMFDQGRHRDQTQTAKRTHLKKPDGYLFGATDSELIRWLFGADVSTGLPAVRFASGSELVLERRFFSFS